MIRYTDVVKIEFFFCWMKVQNSIIEINVALIFVLFI